MPLSLTTPILVPVSHALPVGVRPLVPIVGRTIDNRQNRHKPLYSQGLRNPYRWKDDKDPPTLDYIDYH